MKIVRITDDFLKGIKKIGRDENMRFKNPYPHPV